MVILFDSSNWNRLKPGIFCMLFLYPGKFGRQKRPDRVVLHGQRSGHPHPTVGRQNGEMEVLDGLADNQDFHARNLKMADISTHAGS